MRIVVLGAGTVGTWVADLLCKQRHQVTVVDSDPQKTQRINEELDAYNPLIPDGSNWKATFMVEFPDVEERKAMLSRLLGVEDKVYVKVEGFEPVFAIADEDLDRSDDQKTSAVHFMRFELPPDQVEALKGGAELAAGIEHENYMVEISPLAENIRRSLLGDLD